MDAQTASSAKRPRRLGLLAMAAMLATVLAGCAASPEAARAPGGVGADPGNQGEPVELHGTQDRFDSIYYGIPYLGPAVAREDTSQS